MVSILQGKTVLLILPSFPELPEFNRESSFLLESVKPRLSEHSPPLCRCEQLFLFLHLRILFCLCPCIAVLKTYSVSVDFAYKANQRSVRLSVLLLFTSRRVGTIYQLEVKMLLFPSSVFPLPKGGSDNV